MPRGDGTGPMGAGPMTGRAAGICAGNSVAGSANAPGGRGGRGGDRRGRRGRRRRSRANGLTGWQRAEAEMPVAGSEDVAQAAPAGVSDLPGVSKERELVLLKRQAEDLAATLDEIKQRVAGLEALPQDGQ